MKITGYCTECHKIRTVRVQRFMPHKNVQHGVCSACEAEEDRKRQEAFERRRAR